VDILFMNGMPALISVSGAMRFLQVTWLKGKDYPHVKKHLLLHVSKLRREGFRVTGLHADGEGAIAKAEVDLPEGCIFNARTKAQRARGVIATSPYRLSSILLMWLD
jgi:hypothetical protein